MALNTQISNAARSVMIDALAAQLNNGFLDIYDSTGTGQPAGPGTAVTTQVKLARLPLSATAFAASVNGVAAANAITTANALASGNATWFRALKADGVTAVVDGSAGVATSNLILNFAAIVASSPVSISSWTLTEPAAGA